MRERALPKKRLIARGILPPLIRGLTAAWVLLFALDHSQSLAGLRIPAAPVKASFQENSAALPFDPQKLEDLNLFGAQVSDEKLNRALNDHQNKLSSRFSVPKGMKNKVKFWLKVYTRYSSEQVILFDERHPELTYEVLDFRDLRAKYSDPVRYEIYRERRIHRVIAQYKKAFRRLAQNPNPGDPGPYEEKILANLQEVSFHRREHHRFADLRRNLKTQTGQRDHIIKGLARLKPYEEEIRSIFKAYDIPREIVTISLVESSFNTNAVSRVGATGVWQFMDASGQEFLYMPENRKIDERLSPLKSAVAAAMLLKRHHRLLETWPMTIASYNYGLKRLMGIPDEIQKQITPVFEGCRKKKRFLGWAGQNYYAEFLALLHARTYHDSFYPTLPKQKEHTIKYVKLEEEIPALQFAMHHQIPLQTLRELNPDILSIHETLPEGFLIAQPAKKQNLTPLFSDERLGLAQK